MMDDRYLGAAKYERLRWEVEPPVTVPLSKILPEPPHLLMGAGPTPIPAEVACSNAVVINHLGRTMSQVISQIRDMACYVFQTRTRWVMGLSGPGSAAMEMAITNLAWQGTRVLCVENGRFGARMTEMCRRVGANVCVINAEGCCTGPEEVEKHIRLFSPEILTITHGETSTTVVNCYLPEICAIAKSHGCLTIVDAVSTLGTTVFEMDGWGVDVAVSAGQKGLSSISGVSLIAFSEAAWERRKKRSAPIPHWCLDADLAEQFWHKGSYHYTAPVSGLLSLHEALRLICEETLSSRFARHNRCSLALQAAMGALGLAMAAPKEYRLNSVIGVKLPEGIESKPFCLQLSQKHNVEVSDAFGAPMIRIGQMGEQCRWPNILRVVESVGAVLLGRGVRVDLVGAIDELARVYDFNDS